MSYGIEPILCTTLESSDDILVEIAKKKGVKFFRGSTKNKLKRWVDCATHFNIDLFHTVDADDPFFDGNEIHDSLNLLKDGAYDMICPTASSSNGGASVGYSLTTKIAKNVSDGIPEDADTEMMWFYMEKHPNIKFVSLPDKNPLPFQVRLTLDYEEDYWLLDSVRRILGENTSREKINQLFISNPDLYKINWFRNQDWSSGQLAKK